MNDNYFDKLTRVLAQSTSRRGALKALLSGLVSMLFLSHQGPDAEVASAKPPVQSLDHKIFLPLISTTFSCPETYSCATCEQNSTDNTLNCTPVCSNELIRDMCALVVHEPHYQILARHLIEEGYAGGSGKALEMHKDGEPDTLVFETSYSHLTVVDATASIFYVKDQYTGETEVYAVIFQDGYFNWYIIVNSLEVIEYIIPSEDIYLQAPNKMQIDPIICTLLCRPVCGQVMNFVCRAMAAALCMRSGSPLCINVLTGACRSYTTVNCTANCLELCKCSDGVECNGSCCRPGEICCNKQCIPASQPCCPPVPEYPSMTYTACGHGCCYPLNPRAETCCQGKCQRFGSNLNCNGNCSVCASGTTCCADGEGSSIGCVDPSYRCPY